MSNYQIKLRKFKIKNFRKFDQIDFDFKEGNYFTLSGRNGTGKTSMLEAINICLSERSSKFTDIKETDFYSDNPIEFEVEFNNYFFLRFEDKYNNSYSGLIPCKKFKKVISRRNRKEQGKFFSSQYDIKWDIQVENFEPDNTSFDSIKDSIKELKSTDTHLVRKFILEDGKYFYNIQSLPDDKDRRELNILGLQYLPKLLFPKAFYLDNNRDRELLSQYNTSFSDLIGELNWRFRRKFLEQENKDTIIEKYTQLHESIEQLDSYQKEILEPSIHILKNNFDLDLASVGVYLFNLYQPYTNSLFGKINQGNQLIPVTQFGSGIAILVALSISIAFARETKEPIIIMIDEPELHLHSNLQKDLVKFLKSSVDFQSIISTHSHLFIDKEYFSNNIILEDDEDEKIIRKYANQLEVADLQFRLLGNTLDDLYIPESILLVEGVYDKKIIIKCLTLLGKEDLAIQILDCEGWTDIPNKADRFEKILASILEGNNWFNEYYKKNLRIIIDSDVPATTVHSWKIKYNLDDKFVNHLSKILEYLYPESLIRNCTSNTLLRNGESLKDKPKEEIIHIILSDEDEKDNNKRLQSENRISKQRFNRYIEENITKDILQTSEGSELMNLINWVITLQEKESTDSL